MSSGVGSALEKIWKYFQDQMVARFGESWDQIWFVDALDQQIYGVAELGGEGGAGAAASPAAIAVPRGGLFEKKVEIGKIDKGLQGVFAGGDPSDLTGKDLLLYKIVERLMKLGTLVVLVDANSQLENFGIRGFFYHGPLKIDGVSTGESRSVIVLERSVFDRYPALFFSSLAHEAFHAAERAKLQNGQQTPYQIYFNDPNSRKGYGNKLTVEEVQTWTKNFIRQFKQSTEGLGGNREVMSVIRRKVAEIDPSWKEPKDWTQLADDQKSVLSKIKLDRFDILPDPIMYFSESPEMMKTVADRTNRFISAIKYNTDRRVLRSPHLEIEIPKSSGVPNDWERVCFPSVIPQASQSNASLEQGALAQLESTANIAQRALGLMTGITNKSYFRFSSAGYEAEPTALDYLELQNSLGQLGRLVNYSKN